MARGFGLTFAVVKRVYDKYALRVSALVLIAIIGLGAVWFREYLVSRPLGFEPGVAVAPSVSVSPALTPVPLVYSEPFDGSVLRGDSPHMPVWSDTLLLFETHSGVDYAGSGEVRACADGTVAFVGRDDLFGLTVEIDHPDGARSVYSSLSECRVSVGERVRGGDAIARSGDTALCEAALGDHLHFELRGARLSGGQ